jgi:ankyrin repeat protein
VYYVRYDVVKELVDFKGIDLNMGEIKLRSVLPQSCIITCGSLLTLSSKAWHFATFRALTAGASDAEKKVMNLFESRVDFKYDFDLSPVLCALLGQYDFDDQEKPTLEQLLQFGRDVIKLPPDTDLKKYKRELRSRSPLYREVFARIIQAGNTKGERLGALYNLIHGADSLQCWTPIQWSCYVGRFSEFEILYQNAADIFSITPSRRNVLHQAAESGAPDILVFLLKNDFHHRGLEINLQDHWQETPLHVACGRSAASAKLLLDHGADYKLLQGDGQVPLHYVRLLEELEAMQCLEALLKVRDPPVNVPDDSGKPPLFYLLNKPNCVKALLESGAETNILDYSRRSILHHACLEDCPQTLETLLRHLPEGGIPIKDKNGQTPINICFEKRRIDCALILLNNKMVEDEIDKKGWSLTHLAVKLGNEDVLRLTLAVLNPSLNLRTYDGEDVFDIASAQGTLNGRIGEVLREAWIQKYNEPPIINQPKPTSLQLLAMAR